MDELNIKTEFMRGLASKMLASMIRKKLGYRVNIKIQDLNISISENEASIQLNMDANMNIDEFKKFTKFIEE